MNALRSSLRLIPALFLAGSVLLPQTASAKQKDACNVINSTVAEAVLGEAVGAAQSETQPTGAGDLFSCRFRTSQGPAYKAKSLTLSFRYGDAGAPDMAGISDTMKTSGFKVETISGIGDHALWCTMSALGRARDELIVRKGDSVTLMILIVGVPDQAAALDRAKSLASKTLPQL